MLDFREYYKRGKEMVETGEDSKFGKAFQVALFMYDWDMTCMLLKGGKQKNEVHRK